MVSIKIIVLRSVEISHIFHCLYQSVCKLPGVSARAGMLTVYAPVHCMQKGGRKQGRERKRSLHPGRRKEVKVKIMAELGITGSGMGRKME